MITLGTQNPSYNIVGSQLKIYVRPTETFAQPSGERPRQPCREEAKGEYVRQCRHYWEQARNPVHWAEVSVQLAEREILPHTNVQRLSTR